MRYWAVLGFQALLAIGILGFALAAIRVTSVLWLLVCLAVISVSGVLFWKLVQDRRPHPGRRSPGAVTT